MPRPHDAFFKSIFSDVGHAKDLLRGILPPAVLESLDLDHLEPVPANFVSESLDESFSDLLFTCPLQGNQAVVAILLEHKTWQPKHVHLQILRYMVSIWEADQAENRALRPVIPILVHQGPSLETCAFHANFLPYRIRFGRLSPTFGWCLRISPRWMTNPSGVTSAIPWCGSPSRS
ncbi:MAG: Rpn family recombination-promoting nuclease/putative transposase [Fibrobacteres bacterium]|nr:Rpn family recombination-promoting nuclease/putative transposase [Fibrobacterota bacterium]